MTAVRLAVLRRAEDFNRLVLDSETFRDNPARWWGQLAPDVALTVAGGAGIASKLLSRAGAGTRLADNLADAARIVRAGEDVADSAPPVVGVAATTTEGWREVAEGLPRGNQSHVRLVESEEALRDVFDRMTTGGEPIAARGAKIPEVYRLPDGTEVQWRYGSKSGGPAVDIFPSQGEDLKIHVEID